MGLQIGAGDLNPSMAAIPERTTCLWRSRERTTWLCGVGGDHVALGCSLLPRSLGSRRDFARKNRGERTLAGGP